MAFRIDARQEFFGLSEVIHGQHRRNMSRHQKREAVVGVAI